MGWTHQTMTADPDRAIATFHKDARACRVQVVRDATDPDNSTAAVKVSSPTGPWGGLLLLQ